MIDAVLACIDAVAATAPPSGLPRADDPHLGLREGWDEVDRDPTAFLRLGLCEPRWLVANLATLRDAAHAAPLAGEALLHLDVRSDNVCLRPDGRAALVDWNWTSVGNPGIDTAFWLPSLEAEGGPRPDEVLPEAAPELVACWAGYLCSHAAREPIATAPDVRGAQLRQARSALPWAARRLGLAPPW
jgi:aminoglycoside phosphotransferase (APT) family kinase protein